MGELVRRSTTPAKAAGKTPAKKAPAKKAVAKKAKAPAGKAAPKKAGKKAPAKKTAAKKAPGKKIPPHKADAHRPTKKATKTQGTKTQGTKSTASKAATGQRARGKTTPDPAMGLPQLSAPPADPLAVLGLTEPLQLSELRRAWRGFAARHHPDRGGDAVTFARGQTAYEHLQQRLGDRDELR